MASYTKLHKECNTTTLTNNECVMTIDENDGILSICKLLQQETKEVFQLILGENRINRNQANG